MRMYHHDFVTNITILPHRCDVLFCSVNYSLKLYHDDFYYSYAVPFPPQLATATMKRRAEYLASRIGCNVLLNRFELPGQVLCPNPPERLPIWPPGCKGSISHTDGMAVVFLTLNLNLLIGVDVELINRSSVEMIRNIFKDVCPRLNERKAIVCMAKDLKIPVEEAMLISFSAKECLFKALYPVIGQYFGFNCALITMIDYYTVCLRLTTTLNSEYKKNEIFTSSYDVSGGGVINTILMR